MYFEISQDGAGFLKAQENPNDGFYTQDIQTCIAYVFYGPEGLALVHDTGQLLVGSIVTIAKRCGRINNSYYAINPSLIRDCEIKHHRLRRERINNLLSLRKPMRKLESSLGKILCRNDGAIVISEADILSAVTDKTISRIPSGEMRHQINLLNNLFHDKNAQSIPVDVQFDEKIYTPLPAFIKILREMEQRALKEENNGDLDYRKNLDKGKQLNIFNGG